MKPTRATLHLARPDDAPLQVRRLEHESDSHYERRCASIRALGVLWCRHPAYPSPARHSIHESVWKAARAVFLADIARRAEADRQRNPAHQQWTRLRALMGEGQ